MRYCRNMQYLRYKIQGNYNMCTSKCHGKSRYRGINIVYIRVKLFYKHNGTPQGTLKQRFLTSSLNDGGERSVGEVQQNKMTLRMNATFLKVLQEVLSGILIMELNVRRGNGIRRRRAGTLKRILARNGFMRFGCHAQFIREREKKREREHHNQKTRIEKKGKDVCMNM